MKKVQKWGKNFSAESLKCSWNGSKRNRDEERWLHAQCLKEINRKKTRMYDSAIVYIYIKTWCLSLARLC